MLHTIEELRGQPYAKVAVEARQLLMNITTPSIEDRQRALYVDLTQAVKAWEANPDSGEVVKGYRNMGHQLGQITQSVHSIFEELAAFMTPDQVHILPLALPLLPLS